MAADHKAVRALAPIRLLLMAARVVPDRQANHDPVIHRTVVLLLVATGVLAPSVAAEDRKAALVLEAIVLLMANPNPVIRNVVR